MRCLYTPFVTLIVFSFFFVRLSLRVCSYICVSIFPAAILVLRILSQLFPKKKRERRKMKKGSLCRRLFPEAGTIIIRTYGRNPRLCFVTAGEVPGRRGPRGNGHAALEGVICAGNWSMARGVLWLPSSAHFLMTPHLFLRSAGACPRACPLRGIRGARESPLTATWKLVPGAAEQAETFIRTRIGSRVL